VHATSEVLCVVDVAQGTSVPVRTSVTKISVEDIPAITEMYMT